MLCLQDQNTCVDTTTEVKKVLIDHVELTYEYQLFIGHCPDHSKA